MEDLEEQKIKIIKSNRRTKTVSARMEDDVMVIRAPTNISEEELTAMIEDFKKRFERKAKKARLDDSGLDKRAQELNQLYFDGQLHWNSMTWSTRQNSRYGSCTPANKTIRISHQLEKTERARGYLMAMGLEELNAD